MLRPLFSISAFFGALCAASAAIAQPQAIATHKDWSVFVREANGEKICFAATEAKDKAPKSVRHGDIFFIVATWQSGAAKNQPSFMAGYDLADAPTPTIRVGSDKWNMYTSSNEAFIESAADEERLVGAMRRGARMRISAVSKRGTATNYQISLSGVSAALDRVGRECR